MEQNHLCIFGRGYLQEQICKKYFGPVIQEEMHLNHISYLEVWWSFFQRSGTICAILVEDIMRNNSVKSFLNLDQWLRRRYLLTKIIIWSSGGPFVRWSGTICAILVEGIMRNYSVKLF